MSAETPLQDGNPQKQPRRGSFGWSKKHTLVTVVVLAILSMPILGVLVMTALTLLPPDLEEISGQVVPIEDRHGRKPMPKGACGLNQRAGTSGCTNLDGLDFDEREVTFPSSLSEKGLTELKGTLTIPKRADGERRPGVILVHGSGPNLRDEEVPGELVHTLDEPFPVFKHLAHHLARQGLVVLRYDKRSSPAYREDWAFDISQFEFEDFVVDARDAASWLAKQPEVDGSVVVMGHSQGGQLAPHIAKDHEAVIAIVMLAGTTQLFGEVVVEQLERLADIRRRNSDYLGALMVEAQAAKMKGCFEKLEGDAYKPEEICLGGGVQQRALKNYEELNATTPQVLASLDCPIMAIQGSVDQNIDPGEPARLQKILSGRDAEVHIIPGVGHTLTQVVDPLEPEQLSPELLERLDRFLSTVPQTGP